VRFMSFRPAPLAILVEIVRFLVELFCSANPLTPERVSTWPAAPAPLLLLPTSWLAAVPAPVATPTRISPMFFCAAVALAMLRPIDAQALVKTAISVEVGRTPVSQLARVSQAEAAAVALNASVPA